MKKLLILITFALLLINESNAQRKFIFKHEIGAGTGISNFQGDFLSGGPLDGKITANGFSIEGSHYMHVIPRSYRASKIFRYMMLKTSLGYNYASFNNDGLGDNPNNNNESNDYLRRLTSRSSIISFDNELQFYYKDILKFLYKRGRRYGKKASKFNPYLGIGFGVNYYNSSPDYDSTETNSLGQLIYPDNYEESFIKDESGLSVSGNFSIGTRYKLGHRYNLFAEMKVKYFSSDWIDGVNPDLSGNSFNDYNTSINIGVIYNIF